LPSVAGTQKPGRETGLLCKFGGGAGNRTPDTTDMSRML
jgi:hypothetical protein